MASKTERIGMRIAPEKKDEWLIVAKQWGYPNLTPFIEAMVDWTILYEKFNGDHSKVLEAMEK